jgi:hypothetical protein
VGDLRVVVLRQGDGVFVGSFDVHTLRVLPLVRVSGKEKWVSAACARTQGDAIVVSWRERDATMKVLWRANGIEPARAVDPREGCGA